MSISVMKQALQALEFFCEYGIIDRPFERIAELKQAIEQAEKQEPVAWADMEVRGEDKGLSWTPGYFHTQPLYTAPVYASDISQEPVDETAKDEHEPWVKTYCGGKPNYTTQPDDIYDVWVEQKIKEKNVSQP